MGEGDTSRRIQLISKMINISKYIAFLFLIKDIRLARKNETLALPCG